MALATIAVTQLVHVPLNDAIAAAGEPSSTDATQVRLDAHERWRRGWNPVRCATSLAAVASAAWALHLAGRARCVPPAVENPGGASPVR